MKNKASLLNIVLALTVVILVFQINNTDQQIKPATPAVSAIHQAQPHDSISSVKKSVGPKGLIMPMPALVIGSYSAEGEPDIMTAAWAGIANSDPMSIAVSIRSSRKTYENIMATGCFTVNVPSARYVAEMDYAGLVSGHDENKFKTLNLTPVKGDFVNAPFVGEFPIVIECEVSEMIDLGSHRQFIGKVIDTKVNQNLLSTDGHVDIEALQPIIYAEGYYYGYGQRLAKPWDIYKKFKDDMEPTFQPVIHPNPTLSTIYNRKSVRHFTNEQVREDELTELVKAGMAAPTAVNKQPWAFIAINDRAMLDVLADSLPHAKMLKQATAAIAVCGDLNKALQGQARIYWVQDCSAATQNILLATEAMGLGAVWTGVHPITEREATVKNLLNLPEHIIPLNVIAIGHPTGEDQPKDKWKPENMHINKW
ncbi:flavin reductase [Carboxylicivirga caseinilyticus]|uniref:flavin reductase n=1 Tax=Carboxylicivirga caseinilyticus TaxID=3417572 RepID=UPI003D3481F8|nr:nitroreductase family protein [Marinilabiliaceae bacterium A049]